MRWPWQKPETRETQPFSDAVITALLQAAAGTSAGDPAEIAALETAASLYAACFAAATLTPAIPALTPAVRGLLARDCIRRGESVHQIRIEAGGLRLQPIGSWDVRGGPDERSWYYRIDEFGPSGNLTHFVPSPAVIHCRYAIDPSRPWLGLGPLQWARSTGALAANLETRLSEEAGGPVGHLLPIPQDGGDGEEETDPLAGLKKDLASGKGRTMLIETVAAAWGDGRAAAPMEDWKPRRFGANPPVTLSTLRTDAALAVLAACGVPAALVTDSDGTAQRESWRRFAMGPLAGLAAIIEAELSAKLDTLVKFDFAVLWAHDLAGRAAAFQKFIAGGLDVDKALALSGLMTDA